MAPGGQAPCCVTRDSTKTNASESRAPRDDTTLLECTAALHVPYRHLQDHRICGSGAQELLPVNAQLSYCTANRTRLQITATPIG